MIDLDLSDLGLDDFAPRKPEKIAKPDWYFDAKPHFQAIIIVQLIYTNKMKSSF